MNRTLIIILLSIPFIGFGQNNKLLEYINGFNGDYNLGNIPDTVKVNSSNVCNWIGENMYQYDISIYNSIVDTMKFIGDRYGDVRVQTHLDMLDQLLNKYYNILKYQSKEFDFNLIKENQKIWLTYRDNNRDPITINNGFNRTIVYISEFEIELYKLRIKELCYYMTINCNDFFWYDFDR